MAKKGKHLLEESVARRFMGLAGTGALADNFVKNKYKRTLKESDETEELDEEKEDLEEVITDEDLVGRQTEKGARLAEMPEDDMGGELPPEEEVPMDDEPAMGGGGDVDVESLVTKLADVIEAETGVPVDVEGAGGEEELPDDDMGDEMGGDLGGEEEMMEASEALARAGYTLDEKSGKYYKKMEESSDEAEQLAEGKEEDVKEEKDVQKEGDEENLDEEAQTLKSTKPGNPGKVKTGSTERVAGAPKPGPVEHNHADHTLSNGPKPDLKTLEERVMARVLGKLKEELASRKTSGSKKK